MNPLIAQLSDIYGTREKLASAAQEAPAPEISAEEQQLNEYVVADLEKVAAAQGVDLDSFSDEDLQELFEAHKAELLKEAGLDGDGAGEIDATSAEAMAVGDLIGRTALHAFYHEAGRVQAEAEMHEKLAGLSDEEIFEALATQRAENILAALEGEPEGFFKEAALELDPEDEALDEAITLRAAELLDENDYDVEAIAAALHG